MLRKTGFVLAVAAGFALSACADYTSQRALDDPDLNPDPQESFNRAMFGVHNAIDTVLLRPVTSVYRFAVPQEGRNLVSNFVHNLGSPVYFANSLLQGDADNGAAVLFRFVVNTTAGVGGLFDVADEAGLKARDTDFGQTLAVWGVPSGHYVFVPVFGPGTMRDTFGRLVDLLWNPSLWARDNAYAYAQTGLTILDRRSANYVLIDDIFRTSLDPYATFRSGYLQKRAAEIRKAQAARRSVVYKDSGAHE